MHTILASIKRMAIAFSIAAAAYGGIASVLMLIFGSPTFGWVEALGLPLFAAYSIGYWAIILFALIGIPIWALVRLSRAISRYFKRRPSVGRDPHA